MARGASFAVACESAISISSKYQRVFMSVLSFHPAYLIASILFDIGFDVPLQFLAAVWWDYES